MTVTQLFNHFYRLPDQVFFVEGQSLKDADKEASWQMTTYVRGFEDRFGDRKVRDWKLWNYESDNQHLEISLEV